MIYRLYWIFILRHLMKMKSKKFESSFLSFVKNSSFAGNNRINGRSIVVDSKFGKFTYCNGSQIVNAEIGSFCSIAQNALIGGLGRHPTDRISTHPAFYSNKNQCGEHFFHDEDYFETNLTRVGNDVWIGANSIILDGVIIGNGVIVAAGAIVTKDVPDYAIVGGVPAKVIRFRFNDNDIKKLVNLQWWNLPEKDIRQNARNFSIDDASQFVSSITDIGKSN